MENMYVDLDKDATLTCGPAYQLVHGRAHAGGSFKVGNIASKDAFAVTMVWMARDKVGGMRLPCSVVTFRPWALCQSSAPLELHKQRPCHHY